MVITGYARRIEQELTPATIIDPTYAASNDPAVLAAHCLEQVDPTLSEQTREGDILVVAGYLHAGEPIESAIFALQALGIVVVLGAGADEALITQAGELGLPLLVHPDASASIASGSILRLNLERGSIEDQHAGITWQSLPCPPEVLAAVQRMLLLQRMRRLAEDEGLGE